MKTYLDWRGSLNEYLQIGDQVDKEMVDYFINVLPPACWNSRVIQIGEPYYHVEGKATYNTLKNTSEGWTYAGTCHRGQTEHKESMY
jgi:hypothetical protein